MNGGDGFRRLFRQRGGSESGSWVLEVAGTECSKGPGAYNTDVPRGAVKDSPALAPSSNRLAGHTLQATPIGGEPPLENPPQVVRDEEPGQSELFGARTLGRASCKYLAPLDGGSRRGAVVGSTR